MYAAPTFYDEVGPGTRVHVLNSPEAPAPPDEGKAVPNASVPPDPAPPAPPPEPPIADTTTTVAPAPPTTSGVFVPSTLPGGPPVPPVP
jgi:hypothetical protein